MVFIRCRRGARVMGRLVRETLTLTASQRFEGLIFSSMSTRLAVKAARTRGLQRGSCAARATLARGHSIAMLLSRTRQSESGARLL